MGFKKILPVFAGLSLLFFSCDGIFTMTQPESVAIKSDARFELGVGAIDYDVSEALSMDSIEKNIASSLGDSVKVYQYIPKYTEDCLTYLVDYPIYTLSLDAGKYLSQTKSSDVSEATEGLEFSETVEIPEINFDDSASSFKVPDVGQKITDNVQSFFTAIPEIGPLSEDSAVAETTLQTISVKSDSGVSYDRIFYESGSRVVVSVKQTSGDTAGSGFKLELMSTILDGSNNELSSSGWKDLTAGDENAKEYIALDIAEGFPQGFKIEIKFRTSAGEAGKTHTYQPSVSFEDEAKIYKITGLNATSTGLGFTGDQTKIEHSVDLSDLNGIFKTATVGKGEISINADIPVINVNGVSTPVWSNVTVTPDVNISGCGITPAVAMDSGAAAGKLLNLEKDLAGIEITPTDTDSTILVSGSYSLTLTDSTVYFINGSSEQEVAISVNGSVEKLSSVTIDLTSEKYSGIQTSYEINKDSTHRITMDMVGYIKEICYGTFDSSDSDVPWKKHANAETLGELCKGLGVECTVVNSFPEGNDIPVEITSNIFNLKKSDGNEVTGEITASGKTDEVNELWTGHPLVDLTGDLTANTKDGKVYADFLFSLFGDGVTDWNLVNLETGKSYTLSIKDFEIVQDWDYMVANLSNLDDISGSKDFASVSLSKVLKAFPVSDDDRAEIMINSVPVYMYAKVPSANFGDGANSQLSGLNLEGIMGYSWTDKDGNSQTRYMTNEDGTSQEIKFVTDVEWPESGSTITSASAVKSRLPDLAELEMRRANGEEIDSVSLWTDFASPMNSRTSDLKLNYDLSMTGSGGGSDFTIYSAFVNDSSNENANMDISIDVAFVLPLKFHLNKKMTVRYMEMYEETYNTPDEDGNYSDILQRTSASDMADYQTYADSIKYMLFEYDVRNYLIPYADTSFIVDSGDSETIDGETIKIFDNQKETFQIGKNTMRFTKEQIKQTLTSYPFHPNFYLIIGNDETSETNPSELMISRSAAGEASEYGKRAMGIDLIFAIKMDKNNPVVIWEKESK